MASSAGIGTALSKLLGSGRRSRSSAWAPLTGPLRADLLAVDDFAVSDRYPIHKRRMSTTISLGSTEPHDRILTVFEVDDAIVSKHHQASDLKNGYFFANQAYEHAPHHPRSGDRHLVEAEVLLPIAGRVLVIGGASLGNYFHNMLNWVSRLVVAEHVAPDLFHDPTIRFMLDRELEAEPFRSMLATLGIDPDRIVWTDYRDDHVVEHALVVSFLHDGEYCVEIAELMARRMQKAVGALVGTSSTRRIWISREEAGRGRQVANIDDIADLLAAHGFERVALERLSFAEQVRLFSEAEVVAGSHGAGFANLIFCPPGGHALVIEKDFSLFLGFNRVFQNIAQSHGLSYSYLRGDTVERPGVDYSMFIAAHSSDVRVDRAAFADALARCAPIEQSYAGNQRKLGNGLSSCLIINSGSK